MTTHVPALLADEGEPSVAFALLEKSGWTTHTDPTANSQMVAPGGQARLVFQPESAEYANTDVLWKVEAVTFGLARGDELMTVPAKPRSWSATFSGEVPVELIAAFLQPLVAPDGIARPTADAGSAEDPVAA